MCVCLGSIHLFRFWNKKTGESRKTDRVVKYPTKEKFSPKKRKKNWRWVAQTKILHCQECFWYLRKYFGEKKSRKQINMTLPLTSCHGLYRNTAAKAWNCSIIMMALKKWNTNFHFNIYAIRKSRTTLSDVSLGLIAPGKFLLDDPKQGPGTPSVNCKQYECLIHFAVY